MLVTADFASQLTSRNVYRGLRVALHTTQNPAFRNPLRRAVTQLSKWIVTRGQPGHTAHTPHTSPGPRRTLPVASRGRPTRAHGAHRARPTPATSSTCALCSTGASGSCGRCRGGPPRELGARGAATLPFLYVSTSFPVLRVQRIRLYLRCIGTACERITIVSAVSHQIRISQASIDDTAIRL